mmetsp:Transcript_12281/g.21751  ORF Transcript_12281/g.21751 Transcript_12281/m.21751 type:complete len:416 (-) Transcript_12281:21-1268(-)
MYLVVINCVVYMLSTSSTMCHLLEPRKLVELYRERMKDQCGQWQPAYIHHHSASLESSRVLVSVGVEAGLADRMTGTITQFIHALLTHRAFKITVYGGVPDLGLAYNGPYINWSGIPLLPNDVLEPLRLTYRGQRDAPEPSRSFNSSVNAAKYSMLYMTNAGAKNDQMYGHHDLNAEPGSNATIIVASSNRGRSFKVFSNPFHSAVLLKYGLRPDTCFACIFKFLFEPKPEVAEAALSVLSHLHVNEHALKIGIHIRVGDSVFQGHVVRDLNPYEKYFQCAIQLERAHATPGQPVVWFLMSDSLHVRQLAHARYGNKVLTDIYNASFHMNCPHTGDCDQVSSSWKTAALLQASAQLWASSLTDFQVLTPGSGFGRLGAWLASNPYGLHEMHEGRTNCGAGTHDSYLSSSLAGAGV